MPPEYDPLRDAVRRVLTAWDSEEDYNRVHLSEGFWQAMTWLETMYRSEK